MSWIHVAVGALLQQRAGELDLRASSALSTACSAFTQDDPACDPNGQEPGFGHFCDATQVTEQCEDQYCWQGGHCLSNLCEDDLCLPAPPEDFTAKNQAKLAPLRGNFSAHEVQNNMELSNTLTGWNEQFSNAIIFIKEHLVNISKVQNNISATFGPIDDLATAGFPEAVQDVNNGVWESRKRSAKTEKDVEKTEKAFTSDSTKNANSWNKDETTRTLAVQKFDHKLSMELDRYLQKMNEHAGAITLKAGRDIAASQGKLDETADKYTKKFDSEHLNLEEEEEAHDDNTFALEANAANLASDTEYVVESEDPENPGLEYRDKQAEEAIAKAVKESGDYLEDIARDNGDNAEFADKDISISMQDAASALSHHNEMNVDTIAKIGARLKDVLKKSDGVNELDRSHVETALHKKLQESAEMGKQLVELQQEVEKAKHLMRQSTENTVRGTMSDLDAVVDTNEYAFAGKDDALLKSILSNEDVAMSNIAARTHKVEAGLTTEVQQAGAQFTGYVNQAYGELSAGDGSVSSAEDKVSKVHFQEMEQERGLELIPPQETKLTAQSAAVETAVGAARTQITQHASDAVGDIEGDKSKASGTMTEEYAAITGEIGSATTTITATIDGTAGVAAEKLQKMVADNLASFEDLKGDVTVADSVLTAFGTQLSSAKDTLERVPESFAASGGNAKEGYTAISDRVNAWVVDSKGVIEGDIRTGVDDSETALDTMAGEVATTQSEGTPSQQLEELNSMITNADTDAATERTVAATRRAELKTELANQTSTTQAGERTHDQEMHEHSQSVVEIRTQLKALERESSAIFGAVTQEETAKAAATSSTFNGHVGEALHDFTDSVVEVTKKANLAVLKAKKAIDAATRTDTADFSAAFARAREKLHDVSAAQAKEYMAQQLLLGGDPKVLAAEALKTIQMTQGHIDGMILKMTRGVETIADEANQRMRAAVNDHDSERSHIAIDLKSAIRELEQESLDHHADYERHLQTTASGALSAVQASDGALHTAGSSILDNDKKTQEAASSGSTAVQAADDRVGEEFARVAVEQANSENSAAAEGDKGAQYSLGVSTSIQQSGVLLDNAFKSAEDRAGGLVGSGTPESEIEPLQKKADDLGQSYDGAVTGTERAEEEAAAKTTEISGLVDTNLDAAIGTLTGAEALITSAEQRGDTHLSDLKADQTDQHASIESALDQLVDLSGDMNVAMAAKETALEANVREVEKQVNGMSLLSRYAGVEELDRVTGALATGEHQTADAGKMGSAIASGSADVHKRMQQVFTDMGTALDLDLVDTIGRDPERSVRKKLHAARAGLEANLDEAAEKTQAELGAVYERTRANIGEVQKASKLSAEEKERKIQQFKRDAERSTAQIMGQARASMEQQATSKLVLAAKEQELGAMEAHAKMLLEGDFPTASSESVSSKHVAAMIKTAQDKLANQYSLLQEAEGVKWSPSSELSANLKEAENLALHRAEEDSALEQELDTMRAVR